MLTRRAISFSLFVLATTACATEGSRDRSDHTVRTDAYRPAGELVTVPGTGEVMDVVAGGRTAKVLACDDKTCVPSGRIAILASPAQRSMRATALEGAIVGYARSGDGGISNCGMTDELMAAVDVVRDIAYGAQSFDELGAPGTKEIVVERAGTGAYVTVPVTAFPDLPAQEMTYFGDCSCDDVGGTGTCEHHEQKGIHWCERKNGCRTCTHGN